MASLWSKIRGTVETIFQIGLAGPQVKNNAGVVEMRDPTDAIFVITRGAAPVGNDDYTTKLYVDNGTAGGVVREIRLAIGTSASQLSATSIPANAVGITAELDIQTPYTVATTISVGRAGSLSLFMATTDSTPTVAGLYQVMQDTPFGGAALPIVVIVGGAPVAGAGFAIVRYTLPNA